MPTFVKEVGELDIPVLTANPTLILNIILKEFQKKGAKIIDVKVGAHEVFEGKKWRTYLILYEAEKPITI